MIGDCVTPILGESLVTFAALAAADPDVAAGISKLRGLVILDVTRIGIDHGEEHADALLLSSTDRFGDPLDPNP
jgi:hypothetical protein